MRRFWAVLAVGVVLGLVGAHPTHASTTAAPSTAAAPTAESTAPGWGWPLAGEPVVDRAFQPPASAWGAGHRGVDLRGSLGQPVLAAAGGTITYSGLLAGRGVVTVTHSGGLRTTYEPVDARVTTGDVVSVGDVIGTLGTGHASCRLGVSCLHWGLLRGRTYLDPMGLVASGKLQLLPIAAKSPRPDADDDKDRKKKQKKTKQRSRLDRLKELAKRTGKAVTKGVSKAGRAVGRVATKSGKVLGQLAKRYGPTVARVVARQVARSAAASAIAGAAPEIAVGAVVVLAVGGAVYYLRKR